MLKATSDNLTIERAARAIFDFDEDLAETSAREDGFSLKEPRLTWEDLCEVEPATAEAYRGRAKAALLTAGKATRPAN
jgi:hypothetical protein